MRKLLALLLVVLMLASLVACGNNDNPTSSNTSEPTSDVTTTTGDDTTTAGDDTTTAGDDTTTAGDDTTTKGDDTTTKGDDKTTTKGDDKTTTTKGDDKTTTKKDDKKTTTKKDDKTTTKKTTTTKTTTTTTKANPVVKAEAPVTADTADYRDPHSSSYDAQAEAKRQSILNTKDSTLSVTGNGKTYYISATKGDDDNNGTSKASAWRTVENLNNGFSVPAGSVILFERGGVYRNVSLNLKQNVKVGAYGSGPKPQLLGSDKNYADEALWSETSTNVWRAKVENFKPVHSESSGQNNPADIGNIVFDNGKKTASEGKKLYLKQLTTDYQFYFDDNAGYVYIYLSKGNPGKVHSSIEMAPNKHIFCLRATGNTIENVCIKYTGAHGISAAAAKNHTIRNCEIGWIGGAILSGVFERYGNGIELFNTADNCLVENNWIYQCFDAGYTNQSRSGAQTNITVRGNLIEYCLYNMELWTPANDASQPMKNCTYENNILRFAGFGFGTFNRPGSSSTWASHITFNTNNSYCDNVVIKNNVFDTSYRYLVNITAPNQANKQIVSGNTWIQKNYSYAGSSATDPKGTTASIGTLASGGVQGCASQAEMETSVKKFDTNPAKITLDK